MHYRISKQFAISVLPSTHLSFGKGALALISCNIMFDIMISCFSNFRSTDITDYYIDITEGIYWPSMAVLFFLF